MRNYYFFLHRGKFAWEKNPQKQQLSVPIKALGKNLRNLAFIVYYLLQKWYCYPFSVAFSYWPRTRGECVMIHHLSLMPHSTCTWCPGSWVGCRVWPRTRIYPVSVGNWICDRTPTSWIKRTRTEDAVYADGALFQFSPQTGSSHFSYHLSHHFSMLFNRFFSSW